MMKQDLIGTTEHVQLPDYGDEVYTAKVDTGADSSSIWASDVVEKDGQLNYTLFGQGSACYSGKRQSTDKYKVTSVRSSFGHEEIRYKVKLRVKIGTRKFSTWFTLADRSKNSFPILIGKNLLRARFVVDVSRSFILSETTPAEVLLISAKPNELKEFLALAKKSNKVDLNYKAVQFDSILFDINELKTTVINTADSDKDLADYDLVYVKSHWNYPEQSAALAEYLVFKSKRFFDGELKGYTSRGKLSESMKLSTHGVAVPRTFAAFPQLLKKYLKHITSEIGFPMVFKAASADRGKDNFIARDTATLKRLLDTVPQDKIYIAQKYIENSGYWRVNVLGKEPNLAVYRSAFPGDDPLKSHLNKPAGGANATVVPIGELDPEIAQLAVKASIYMKREISGVDIIQDDNSGKMYVIEANNSPQLRSGSNVEEKAHSFAKFIDKELKR